MSTIAHFMDFELETEGLAFYPRPETEILVEKAIEHLRHSKKDSSGPRILDIGTGSGNIAISLTKYIPSSRIVALDVTDAPLRVARRNALRCGVSERIDFVKSDLFRGLGGGYRNFFDMIISNPPYITLRDFRDELPDEVKKDPYIALYGGKDGLEFYRRIAKDSGAYLREEGSLLMEIGYDQAGSVSAILKESGNFSGTEIYKDYSGINRIIKAVRLNDDGNK